MAQFSNSLLCCQVRKASEPLFGDSSDATRDGEKDAN